jgi:hypothetical protein
VSPRETLEDGALRVEVLPGLGGTIAAVRHVASGLSALGATPWDAIEEPEPSGAAADEPAWLARFGGGWPLMFPNAGDACVVDGLRHGFHGEASVAPWRAERRDGALVLSRRFLSAPVRMTRSLRLDGGRLVVEEEATADAPVAAMWGQHVTFGSDLLAGPVEIATNATRVAACATYDPPANPLEPGRVGTWPILPGPDGPVDLSRPGAGWAALACLDGFEGPPWVELRRSDGALAARLDWSADPWPLAWLWIETGGTAEGPWFGRGRLIGVEPCSTWPATGLAAAHAAGAPLARFAPGVARRGRVALRVHVPNAEP